MTRVRAPDAREVILEVEGDRTPMPRDARGWWTLDRGVPPGRGHAFFLDGDGPFRHKRPWGDAVNLDGPGRDEVRRFFRDNALMWLGDYHMDGLRPDAVHAFLDTFPTHFLEQLATDVARLQASSGRHFVLIAESDLNDSRLVRTRESGGYGVDAQWSDDFHHALHAVITGERSGLRRDGSIVRRRRAVARRAAASCTSSAILLHATRTRRSPGQGCVLLASSREPLVRGRAIHLPAESGALVRCGES